LILSRETIVVHATHLPVHSGLDPDDDAAAAAGGEVARRRRRRVDGVLNPPVVALAGLVNHEDERPRARHIPVSSSCAEAGGESQQRCCRRGLPAAVAI
jgi:hypothetical protein